MNNAWKLYEDGAGGLHLHQPEHNRTCFFGAWHEDSGEGLFYHIQDFDWIDDVAHERPEDVYAGAPNLLTLIAEGDDDSITIYRNRLGRSGESFVGIGRAD